MYDAKILPLSWDLFVTGLRRPFFEIVLWVLICKLRSLPRAPKEVSAETGLKACLYLPQRQLNSRHQNEENATEVNHENILSVPSL